ncbi:hypothetical protein [uncultured Litoreibacter sp.]|uniref:hypothetical protein n=1 Tax=uncultured Litoreibacter sp. TaxID=1392394 RepID=UPI002629F74B|nr:hypothetical protein [uncultured Litoreibacter sp.]
MSLIFPVLLPSWRFFQTVEASPRVQWAWVEPSGGSSQAWSDFRPVPQKIDPWRMLVSLFWNPMRNESLFVMSCAERIALHPTPHSIAQIRHRVRADVKQLTAPRIKTNVQFRVVFVQGEGAGQSQETVFTSDPFPLTEFGCP